MNAYEQLAMIRDRLEQNGAHEDTVALVEKFLKRAEPEKFSQTSISQSMMVRHLLRQRDALDNFAIYDDLQELTTERGALDERKVRDEDAAPAAWEEERAPKPKSYYKALKEKSRGDA